jgi:hypothetical protein
MADTVLMWKTGSSVLDVAQAGKWRSLRGEKLARFAKAVEPAGLQLLTMRRASAFPGTAILLPTGSHQLTMMARNTYQAFGRVDTQIA